MRYSDWFRWLSKDVLKSLDRCILANPEVQNIVAVPQLILVTYGQPACLPQWDLCVGLAEMWSVNLQLGSGHWLHLNSHLLSPIILARLCFAKHHHHQGTPGRVGSQCALWLPTTPVISRTVSLFKMLASWIWLWVCLHLIFSIR